MGDQAVPAGHHRSPSEGDFRATYPGGIVVAHPECARETVSLADQVGSTDFSARVVLERMLAIV